MFVPVTPLEFRRRAEQVFGRKVGVIDGQKRLTYAEFGDRSRRLAAALTEMGIQPGQVVSFITHNTHHLLEAYYGVLQAEAVLNPINIRLHPKEIAYIINHAESRALLFHSDFTPMLQEMREGLETVHEFVVLDPQDALPFSAHDYEALLREATPAMVDPEVDENTAAELFYTSCLLYTSPSPRDLSTSRMPSSA